MPAKLIAVANMKGGVGKTTIAVGLAETFASGGRRVGGKHVVLADLDTQANASLSLAGDALLSRLVESGDTIDAYFYDALVRGEQRPARSLVNRGLGVLDNACADEEGAGGCVGLIAASTALRSVERQIVSAVSSAAGAGAEESAEAMTRAALLELVSALDDELEYVIFDCAPGISLLTEAALQLADMVVIPTTPTPLATVGIEAFCETVHWPDSARGAKRPWVLANMVRRSMLEGALAPKAAKALSEIRAEADAADAGFRLFRTEVPESPLLEDAVLGPDEGVDPPRTFLRKYGPDIAEVFENLAEEIDAYFASSLVEPTL